jgi:AraC-like DNA-binding protein
MFREQFGRDKVRVEPLPEHPLRIDAMIAKLPGMGLVWGSRSPLKSEFADGSDRLLFSTGSAAVATQFGRELELAPGEAVALAGADRSTFVTLESSPIVTLEFPSGSIARLLEDPRRSCLRRIPKASPALRLVRTYLRGLLALEFDAASDVAPLASVHLHDLVALALGGSRRTQEAAIVRSLPSARLQRIREDVLARLEEEITVDDIAARHSISPRYVRKLFEDQGTTLTEFVRNERLDRARRRLLIANCGPVRIAEVAYGVGFNDLSYFNRSFRGRFGCSPREMLRSRWSGDD